jgi:hypothetical protein
MLKRLFVFPEFRMTSAHCVERVGLASRILQVAVKLKRQSQLLAGVPQIAGFPSLSGPLRAASSCARPAKSRTPVGS